MGVLCLSIGIKWKKQRLIPRMVAGFVLHPEKDVSKYGNADFYDKYSISTQQLEKNICTSLKHDKINGDYEIILVHLPIEDKKKLILKIIETSQAKLRSM